MGDRRTIEAYCSAQPSAAESLQGVRARGELRLGFAHRAGRTRMVEAYQSGCLRARQPHYETGEAASAILINTAGGVTGGDRLVQSAAWAPGAVATLTTQAAEKIYRSSGHDAHVDTRLHIEAGAQAEWLPQETILFDDARLKRTLEVDMAGDASFLAIETVVLGRSAMGEVVQRGVFHDSWQIRRGGRLVFADAQRLSGAIDQVMDRAAIGAGARTMTLALFAAPHAASMLPAAREALRGAEGRGAASAWNGLLAARLLCRDGQSARQGVVRLLSCLRPGRPVPRVWNC